MKKIFFTLFICTTLGCDKENVGDCFQTAGTIVQQPVDVPEFDKVVAHKNIALVIAQGPEQRVIVETGKNLLPEIEAIVVDGELQLRNNNNCNIFRDYGITKVYVTSPNLSRIRSATEQLTRSEGVLKFPSLFVMSVGDRNKFLSTGDIDLTIENSSLRIWSNGLANIFLKGKTENFELTLSDGDTRFEGSGFKANNIIIDNRSTNDIHVFPINKISGDIFSLGHVYAYNKPPIVEVTEHYTGKLIFK